MKKATARYTPDGLMSPHFYLNFSKMPKRESIFDKELPGVAHESRFEGKINLAPH